MNAPDAKPKSSMNGLAERKPPTLAPASDAPLIGCAVCRVQPMQPRFRGPCNCIKAGTRTSLALRDCGALATIAGLAAAALECLNARVGLEPPTVELVVGLLFGLLALHLHGL